MKTNQFTPVANRQIEALRLNIACLEALKTAATKFDGKIVNKRFSDYYETIAPVVDRWDGAKVPAAWLSFDSSYYNTPRLTMRDRSAGRGQMTFYNNKVYGERMDAAKFNEEIDSYISHIADEIESFQMARDNYDKIMAKYRKIAAELTALKEYRFIRPYDNTLDYQIRQLMEVSC